MITLFIVPKFVVHYSHPHFVSHVLPRWWFEVHEALELWSFNDLFSRLVRLKRDSKIILCWDMYDVWIFEF